MRATDPSRPSHSISQRIDELASSRPYDTYLRVRDRVLAMKDADAVRESGPSPYWQAELRWFEYMLDAGPLVVDRLRWHTHHVTGLKAYDYGEHHDAGPLTARLEALLRRAEAAPGGELFVPEHPALGGFGFRDPEGRLFNRDTLKFLEALIALADGGALDAFRDSEGGRRVALEIGAGWGGFAYQFKTLWPDTTYVIVDLPELFVFSAVYLQTVFPDAKLRFYTETEEHRVFDGWESVDFVFVPHTRLDLVRPPHADLAINMVSFQEMRTEQVRAYVRHASELGVPCLYSLNRERSRYNPELEGVSRILAERYQPCEVEVLPTSYVKASTKRRAAPVRPSRRPLELARRFLSGGTAPTGSPSGPTEDDYRHLVGWRHHPPELPR